VIKLNHQLGFVLAVSLAVLVAPQALAQRPQGRGFGGGGGFGGPNNLGLLSQKSVQDELKLTEDQIKQVTAETEKQRESRGALADLSREERQKKFAEQSQAGDKAAAGILQPDQLKRLKQISLQQRGGRAFSDPDVAQSLALTDKQKELASTIQQGAQSDLRELFQAGADGEARAKIREIQKKTSEKVLEILTPEQQTKWKELTGEPFKGEIQPPQFRGRNRQAAGT